MMGIIYEMIMLSKIWNNCIEVVIILVEKI